MTRRAAILVCALATALSLTATRSSGAALAGVTVRTLAVVPGGVEALAQDGDRVAWLRKSCTAQHAADVLDLSHRRTTPLRGPCRGWRDFALAGSRVLWLAVTGWGNTEMEAELVTASVAQPLARGLLAWTVFLNDNQMPHLLVQLAGRGETLAASLDGWFDRDAGSPGRGIWTIDRQGRPRRLARDPAELVAVTSSRVAALRSTSATDLKSVSIIDVRTRKQAVTFDVEGSPAAVALSASTLAVAIGDSIQLFSVSMGTKQATVQLPAKADQISISGHTIVFAAGRAIYKLDTRTRDVSLLASARQAAVGLSIDGARVIWAENSVGRARVQSIVLG